MKKKVLLSAVLLAMMTATSAQSSLPSKLEIAKSQIITKSNKTKELKRCIAKESSPLLLSKKSTNATTRANGISYNMPEGAFWMGMDRKGAQWEGSQLYVPAWTTVVFQNSSDNPSATKWLVNGEDVSENVVDNNFQTSYRSSEKRQGFYLPTLKSKTGSNSFSLGETNEKSSIMTYGDVETVICTTDPRDNLWGGWSDGGFLFGNAKSGTALTCVVGYPKPAAPLCVNNIMYYFVTDSDTPLPEGTKMTLEVRKASINNGTYFPTEDVLYKMTAEKNDIFHVFNYGDGTKAYALPFSSKELDPSTGIMSDIPFMLNEPFALVISGFDQPGVSIGLTGSNVNEGISSNSFWNFSTDEPGNYHYYADMNIAPMITGYFNVISINETTNVLQAPKDGGYAVTEDGKYDYAAIFTALPWDDDNYWFESACPSWISLETEVVPLEGTKGGYTAMSFECQPLPEGETGRSWTSYMNSFGSISNLPITIYQGEYSGINDAIDNNNVKVLKVDNGYSVSYPETITNVAIINVAGQTIANYELPIGGQSTINTNNISNGIYLLKFNNNQVIKIIK